MYPRLEHIGFRQPTGRSYRSLVLVRFIRRLHKRNYGYSPAGNLERIVVGKAVPLKRGFDSMAKPQLAADFE